MKMHGITNPKFKNNYSLSFYTIETFLFTWPFTKREDFQFIPNLNINTVKARITVPADCSQPKIIRPLLNLSSSQI
jgi:hypothetical protein